MSSDIKFGTDGWRGIIARDFNFTNVKIVTQAICDYLKKQVTGDCLPADVLVVGRLVTLLVGYDTRFLSREYAEEAAKVLQGNGFKVLISPEPVPTPVVSYNIVKRKAMGAIIITASHNPYSFNGLKFKTAQGASASVKITNLIERYLYHNKPMLSQKIGQDLDYKSLYLKHILSLINLAHLKNKKFKIIVDPIFGTGQGYIENILESTNCRVAAIHHNADPLFGGLNPEPISSNLKGLIEEVKRQKADIGIAFDGDGDRVGLVDEKGNFVNSHQIFALLLLHLVKNKKRKGKVVKTISGTYLINRIVKHYNLKLYETPIGFKHIADLMLKENILIGGEESGGIGFQNHVPERDGILSGLLILEMMGYENKSLGELVQDLYKQFGYSYYERVDLHLKHKVEKKVFQDKILKKPPNKLIGRDIQQIKTYDGVKFILANDSWLLVRPSGTEPVVRIYAEAPRISQVKKLIDIGQKLVYKMKH